MMRPLFGAGPGGATGPTLIGGGARQRGLLGHQVWLPGPPIDARTALWKGPSKVKLVVIWRRLAPFSGTSWLVFFFQRCLGIVTWRPGPIVIAVVALTFPAPSMGPLGIPRPIPMTSVVWLMSGITNGPKIALTGISVPIGPIGRLGGKW